MKSKIAVVMPVYETEKFLKRSLDSLLNQTFKDLQIICINDASPDNCLTILEEYQKKDNRIVIINHEENMGPGASRNDGLNYIYLNLPDVEYIAFLDADDKIENETYEKSYEEAKKNNADIINYNFLPSTYWEYKTVPTTDTVIYEGNCLKAIFDNEQFYTFVVCWSKLYKRKLLEDIRFSDQSFYEDGLFAYQVYARAKKLSIIPDTFYEYNIENPESSCSKITEMNRIEAIFNTIKETIIDWKNLGIYEDNINDFINHITLYTSLVCPNVIEGDYTNQLNESFGFNILDEKYSSIMLDNTKKILYKMTNKNKTFLVNE